MDDKELYLKLIQEKLESVMPEVHKQVKIYEEREKAGTLKPLPKDNKTTMKEEKKQLISEIAIQIFKNERSWQYFFADENGLNQHSNEFRTVQECVLDLSKKPERWRFPNEEAKHYFLLGLSFAQEGNIYNDILNEVEALLKTS